VRDATTAQSSVSPTLGDYVLPITNISLNFDNFAGLLSSHSQAQLYRMSQQNGLEMDYSTWRGFASTDLGLTSNTSVGTLLATAFPATQVTLTAVSGGPIRVGMRMSGTAMVASSVVTAVNGNVITFSPATTVNTGTSINFTDAGGWAPLVGGPLVLKPGKDFALSAGQAPSLVGNFSLQFDVSVQNYGLTTSSSQQIFVVAINSGFFETIKGSSRIIKGVLTEQDVLSAPLGAGSADAHMERRLGSGKISEAAEEMSYHQGKPKSNHKSSMSRYT
jgi:hypothetical protein